jgi:hypothetical protein
MTPAPGSGAPAPGRFTRRSVRVRRIALRVVVFLLLGAVVNVAVAWGCALWSPFTRFYDTPPKSYPAWLDSLVGYNASWRYHGGIGYQELIIEELLDPRTLGVFDESSNSADRLFSTSFYSPFDTPAATVSGWPCKSLWSNMRITRDDPRTLLPGLPIPNALPAVAPSTNRRFSLNPVWPGFAINTFFYAAIPWLLFAAPGRVRRWRRIRRGLCAKCAYPIGTSDVCTECGGRVIKAKSRARGSMRLPPLSTGESQRPATPAGTGSERIL